MNTNAEKVRTEALSLLQSVGMNYTLVKGGRSWAVDIDDGHKTKDGHKTRRASVKVAAKGGAMVYASSVDENAKIPGFDGSFDDMLFCVGDPRKGSVAAFLVPAAEAEEAFRSYSRKERRADGGAFWLLALNGDGDKSWDGFQKKWEKYQVGLPVSTSSAIDEGAKIRPQTPIEQAKARLAAHYKVNPEAITITIEW